MPGIWFLANIFLLSIFWMYHPILSWPEKFLLRNMPIVLFGFLVCCLLSFLFVVSKFFNVWQFDVSQCYPIRFNLLEVFWASWIWMSISLSRFGKFLSIIALNILSVPFPFSSPSVILILYIFFWWYPIFPLRFLHFFFFLLFLSMDNFICSVFWVSGTFFCRVRSDVEVLSDSVQLLYSSGLGIVFGVIDGLCFFKLLVLSVHCLFNFVVCMFIKFTKLL